MTLSKSNGKIVLVSGINGFIASRIGMDLLEQGYTLRGTARQAHSADALVNGPYKQYADRVQMLSVPDMTVDGAFDEAVKGVTHILHTASPVTFSVKDWDLVVRPAINGVVKMLDAAAKHAGPQLESVVMTSSVAAVSNPTRQGYTFTAADWNDWAEPKAKELGDDAPGNLLYLASKALAERAFWKFRDDHKPPFSMAAVHPAVVTGPPVLPPPSAAKLNETLLPVWNIFSGEAKELPPSIGSAGYVDVRDVSAVHVWAAEHPSESAGNRYICAVGRGTMQAAADILRKAYPDRTMIAKGEPGTDQLPGWVFPPPPGNRFDSSLAEKALGRPFIKFDQTILDTAKVLEKYL
ncbi:hypothetical protein MMC25_002181 [Agyrium rufum]|nr:hypothetical protein [Agyrium rufum]